MSDLDTLLTDLEQPVTADSADVIDHLKEHAEVDSRQDFTPGLTYQDHPLPVIDRPLKLDQEIFHVAGLHSLLVTGLVNLDWLLFSAAKLVATVRIPPDGNLLTKIEQVLTATEPRQFAFQLPLELPQVTNHFLMGEVMLQGANGQSLAVSNFTITFDPPPESAEPLTDPFAVALQLAMLQQDKQPPMSSALAQSQLREIIAANSLEVVKLDTSDIPLLSYDSTSYEVVVED